jgi:hypothetical protein
LTSVTCGEEEKHSSHCNDVNRTANTNEAVASINRDNTCTNVFSDQNNINKEDDITISFSHFIPRIELTPEKRFLMEPNLVRVSGSDFLEAQIRRLKPHIHVVRD